MQWVIIKDFYGAKMNEYESDKHSLLTLNFMKISVVMFLKHIGNQQWRIRKIFTLMIKMLL